MEAFTKKLVLTLAAVAFAASVGFSGSAKADNVPESEDTIKIAINDWTGQIFQSYIFGELLMKMGYNVEYVVAGYYPQIIALADGNLTTTGELWSSNMGEGWDEWFDSGQVLDMGDSGAAAREGWYYNAKALEMCPGLADSWEALNDCGEIFADAETFPNGRFVDYPIEWGTLNADRSKALGLPISHVPSGSEGGLVAAIISAAERGEPLLMGMYEPHWVFGSYELHHLPLPGFEQACLDDPSWGLNPDKTYDCDWPPTRLYKAAWSGMEAKWPAAFRLFQSQSINGEDQAIAIKQVDVDGMDLHEYVNGWVADNEDRWGPWIEDAMSQ
jgi:glycine betaine/proline transport system substrate-binding protein